MAQGKIRKVAVIGSGSFGTVVASLLCRSSSNNVALWCRREAVAKEIRERGTHSTYFPGFIFNRLRTSVTSDMKRAVKGAEVIVIAVPSQFLGELLPKLVASMSVDDEPVIVSLVKGIHYDRSKKRMRSTSDIIAMSMKSMLRPPQIVALHGGNIYTEMLDDDEYAEATIGTEPSDSGRRAGRRVADVFNSRNFHCTAIDDREGVELSGGLKNVVSLAAGFCVGMKLGHNTKAAVIRCGLLEMQRFRRAISAGVSSSQSSDFLMEASGLGDLLLTCTVGRGQRLASAFVEELIKAKRKESTPPRNADDAAKVSRRKWDALEREMFGGMKLPDWHNAQAVYAALADAEELGTCPLLVAVYAIGFRWTLVDDPRKLMLDALRISSEARSSSPPTSSHALNTVVYPGISGKRCLVTGAAGGIGRAIALKLAAMGARVVAMDRDVSSLGSVLPSSAGHELVACDLLNWKNVEAEIERLNRDDDYDIPVTKVVNCAGIAVFEPIFKTTERAFDLQYGVNVRAIVCLTNAAVKQMIRRGAASDGSIVHISSQSSSIPLKDHLVYSSSKAAVDHLARIQALEFGKQGVRVNSVRPTVVMTELVRKAWDMKRLEVMKGEIPLRRLAQPEDVANAVVWLLSDDASMTTGSALCVDGGRAMGGCGL